MAKFTIGDITGSEQIDITDDSLLAGQKLNDMQSAQAFLAALGKPVTDKAFNDVTLAATFEKPTIPFDKNTVDFKAGVNAVISVARAADTPLFGKDDYDEVDIQGNDCWVGVEFDTLLDAKVSVPLPHGFGVSFEANTTSALATYQLVPGAVAPNEKLSDALSAALSAYNVIATAEQVMKIPAGAIYATDVTGTFTVGGSWSLPTSINQMSLADANLPFNASLSVAPAVTVRVAGSVAVSGAFGVRFRRSRANAIRLGIYKKNGSTLSASFTAAAGLGANVGNTDLIAAFFKAMSDEADLTKLSKDDVAKFQKVLNDSIDQSLAISFNAACSASDSDEAALVYEVNTAANDGGATLDAVAAALGGDWTLLATLDGQGNVQKLRDVVIETIEKKYSLNVNLLGLYNYRSVGDFVLNMRVVKNAENGSVVITDKATASRITTGSMPLVAAPDILRVVLYESFVATAAYQALGAGTGFGLTLMAQQDMLIYKNTMSHREALKQLNPGIILGVMPTSVKTAISATGPNVRHARFAASCSYNNDDVMRLFFSDPGKMTARKREELWPVGKATLVKLLDPQDPTDLARIQVLMDPHGWDGMGFNNNSLQGAERVDWFDIVEWAGSVADAGSALADAISYAKKVGRDPTADPKFMKKRRELALAIDAATHDSHGAFDPAFGMCVTAALAGRTPGHDPAPLFEAEWDTKVISGNKAAVAATQAKGAGAPKT
jgi:hypothetical protein